jgi:hypothetical protein
LARVDGRLPYRATATSWWVCVDAKDRIAQPTLLPVTAFASTCPASQVAAQAATSAGEPEPGADVEDEADADVDVLGEAAGQGRASPPSGQGPAGGSGRERFSPARPGTAWTVPKTSGAPLE